MAYISGVPAGTVVSLVECAVCHGRMTWVQGQGSHPDELVLIVGCEPSPPVRECCRPVVLTISRVEVLQCETKEQFAELVSNKYAYASKRPKQHQIAQTRREEAQW